MAKETTKSIIILSGPAGAGKTTVAQEIINSSSSPLVYIEGDKFWFFFVKGIENRSRSKNFKTVMIAMTAAAIPYALAGYEVILDFSMPPWFLETALKITSAREVPLEYVVLRPSEKVCAERAAARHEGTISDYTHYHDLYTSFDEAKPYIIHDDLGNAASVSGLIREGIREGKFRIYEVKPM